MDKTEQKQARRELNRDKIVAAALQILTDEDESALTMRRVATDCGVSAMALYHHVEDKEKIAELAVDHIFLSAATASADRSGNWRGDLVSLLNDVRNRLIAVPGTGTIFIRRAVVSPGTALVTEEMFRLLAAGGITGRAMAEATDSFTMLLIGSVANELTRPARVRDGLVDQLPDGTGTMLADNIEAYSNRDPKARFERALDWVIDGVLASQAHDL